MRDAIAFPAWHATTTAFARALAARLDLQPLELPWPGYPGDAALEVAPAALRTYRSPAAPVVVVKRPPARLETLAGRSVVCGVQDEDDAPCAAVAGALAEALELPLVLAHAMRAPARRSIVFAAPYGLPVMIADRSGHADDAGRWLLRHVARAAGLSEAHPTELRLPGGAPGPALAALARQEHAALVVVSASTRGRLRRALLGSATGHLVRRCDRPVVVCPRDAAAAMRLREATAATPWTPDGGRFP